jgi:hypothetical protein
LKTRHILTIAVLATALCAAARPASAQRGIGGTLKLAIDPSIGGTMHAGGTGTVDGSTLTVSPQSWTDTHSSSSPLFVAGIDVPLGSRASVLVNVEYGRAGGQTTRIGTADGKDLQAEFDPYKFWGIEGGVRAGGRTGPYGTATAGFRHVSDIQVTYNVPTLAKADFYKASDVATLAFGGGYMFGPAIGIEVMAKYAGGLSAADRTSGTLIQTLASQGERWSLPISLVLRF